MITIAAPEWATTDADDRYPGRYTAHIARVEVAGLAFLIRITPGNRDTFTHPGFYAEIEGGRGLTWGMFGNSVEDLKRDAVRDIADELNGLY
jgi:hypothetical protein